MCVCVFVCTCVCVCVCVCVCTHPDFPLSVQQVCNEDWLVVGSRVKCHEGDSSHTLRGKGKK